MTSRRTTSTVTFKYPFSIAGYPDELPAGSYEILVEEDLLQSLSFAAYRRTSTHLLIDGQKGAGRKEMRPIDPRDLELAQCRDRAQLGTTKNDVAASSPPEEIQ